MSEKKKKKTDCFCSVCTVRATSFSLSAQEGKLGKEAKKKKKIISTGRMRRYNGLADGDLGKCVSLCSLMCGRRSRLSWGTFVFDNHVLPFAVALCLLSSCRDTGRTLFVVWRGEGGEVLLLTPPLFFFLLLVGCLCMRAYIYAVP